MPATVPPSPALAAAVRAGQWAEVRALTAAAPQPLPPAVALAAARAARSLGEPARALELLRNVLSGAGELSAALRLEAAEAAVALAQDPWPFLAPLLSRSSPPAYRRAATAVLRRAWETLPLPILERTSRRALSRPLRRELVATMAVRGADEALALHVLAERVEDESSVRAAQWLAGRSDLAPTTQLAVAEELLAGGAWRRAEAVLLALPQPPEPRAGFRWAYLRGRAAYRLGELERAGEALDQALALARSEEERFTAAVQRARVAELRGDPSTAVAFWDTARAARPREVEGWDGSTRLRVTLGHGEDAVTLLATCPGTVLHVVGPRLAAILLLHRDVVHARLLLARLSGRLPVVRALLVALSVQAGRLDTARDTATLLLADPHGGPWRDQVLKLLPSPPDDGAPAPASRDPMVLARIATRLGAPAARRALAAALLADPSWAAVLADATTDPTGWKGPAAELATVGLEREAAAIYPHAFPGASPSELGWSAHALAAWGNPTAALAAGERVWARLGPLPAVLLPDAALPAILPPSLTGACVEAARQCTIPANWLVAIVRQESRFDAAAYSTAGAVGIAQLVPETAHRLGASPAELRDSGRSLLLAARELARLSGEFGGRLAPVAASYNAGEAVVSSWLAEFGEDPGGVLFTAAVPYRETAGYVLAVQEGATLARYLK